MNTTRKIALVLFSSLLCGTASAAFEVVATGIDLAPAPEPSERPIGYVWKALKNGSPHETRLIESTADTETWEDSNGCRWTRPKKPMAPSTTWDNCGGRSGTATVTDQGGTVFPMKVGNAWSYEVDGGRWRTDRDCEVEDAVRVRIALGEYDSFKVICTDRWRTRTYYYAPALEKSVYFENVHRTRGEHDRYELAAE